MSVWSSEGYHAMKQRVRIALLRKRATGAKMVMVDELQVFIVERTPSYSDHGIPYHASTKYAETSRGIPG